MAGKASLREAYGKTLLDLGKINPDIVVLDADLSKSTMTILFAKEYPERFFECGISEQNMIGLAAGLACCGKIPFASTFAVFAPGRCFDQIRVSITQSNHNIKIVTTHGGLTVGEDGASHQAIEDLSLVTSMPGMTVVVPSDAIETTEVIRMAAVTKGPFYIRLSRMEWPVINMGNYQFKLGKAAQLRQGKMATIIAIGLMVALALEAADKMKLDGIDCCVLNMSTLKPIDEQAIVRAARDTGAIVTVEEHLQHGGLGSMVAEVLAKTIPTPMSFVGINDVYGQSGKPTELLEKYGLTAKDIEQATRRVIARKTA